MIQVALLLVIVAAIAAIQTRYLRHGVIYLGLFSLGIAFIYFLYNAPDVALAEAIIGSTLSTVLFIVALQKYKIFTIYFIFHYEDDIGEDVSMQSIIKSLEKFCTKQELEAQIIYTTEPLPVIIEAHQFSVIMSKQNQQYDLYIHENNYKIDALRSFLSVELPTVNVKLLED